MNGVRNKRPIKEVSIGYGSDKEESYESLELPSTIR